MAADQNFRFFGRIVKAHGNKGEVVIAPEAGPGAPSAETLYIKNTAGDLIPYRVERSSLREKSSRYSFFVKFASIDNRTDAEAVRNRDVFEYGDTQDYPDDAGDETGSLVGFQVYDENGRYFGKVTGEFETPAHVLIQIEPLEGETLLIPVVNEYVAGQQRSEQKVIVKNIDRFTGI